jgi:hypothetical protein
MTILRLVLFFCFAFLSIAMNGTHTVLHPSASMDATWVALSNAYAANADAPCPAAARSLAKRAAMSVTTMPSHATLRTALNILDQLLVWCDDAELLWDVLQALKRVFIDEASDSSEAAGSSSSEAAGSSLLAFFVKGWIMVWNCIDCLARHGMENVGAQVPACLVAVVRSAVFRTYDVRACHAAGGDGDGAAAAELASLEFVMLGAMSRALAVGLVFDAVVLRACLHAWAGSDDKTLTAGMEFCAAVLRQLSDRGNDEGVAWQARDVVQALQKVVGSAVGRNPIVCAGAVRVLDSCRLCSDDMAALVPVLAAWVAPGLSHSDALFTAFVMCLDASPVCVVVPFVEDMMRGVMCRSPPAVRAAFGCLTDLTIDSREACAMVAEQAAVFANVLVSGVCDADDYLAKCILGLFQNVTFADFALPAGCQAVVLEGAVRMARCHWENHDVVAWSLGLLKNLTVDVRGVQALCRHGDAVKAGLRRALETSEDLARRALPVVCNWSFWCQHGQCLTDFVEDVCPLLESHQFAIVCMAVMACSVWATSAASRQAMMVRRCTAHVLRAYVVFGEGSKVNTALDAADSVGAGDAVRYLPHLTHEHLKAMCHHGLVVQQLYGSAVHEQLLWEAALVADTKVHGAIYGCLVDTVQAVLSTGPYSEMDIDSALVAVKGQARRYPRLQQVLEAEQVCVCAMPSFCVCDTVFFGDGCCLVLCTYMYVAGSSLEQVEQQPLHMDLVCAAAWSASNACASARDRDT